MPLSREARCRACGADLHACRQCRWYDTGKAKDCAEPVADEVRDKERANFCGYFSINPGAHTGSGDADAARARLEALFGLSGGETGAAAATDAPRAHDRGQREADAAREELGRLFGLDDADRQ
jgi:hypothetical protein